MVTEIDFETGVMVTAMRLEHTTDENLAFTTEFGQLVLQKLQYPAGLCTT